MTQSDDKMGAHCTLWSIIPTKRTRNIIKRERKGNLLLFLNKWVSLPLVPFFSGRGDRENGQTVE